jgi:hypothetical protein
MKKFIIIAAIMLGGQLFAQDVPNILDGLNVKFDKEYNEFVIYDDDVDTLIERVSHFELVHKREDEDSILVIKKDDKVEVVISIVLGLKSASVYFTS